LCHAHLHERKPDSLNRALALIITAILLYFPANLLPIMETSQLNTVTPATIIGGVVLLWQLGSYPVAAIIFVASVLVPLGKLIALSYLCWGISTRQQLNPISRTRMYRLTEFVGRWSMVDIFVVSILVALVQIGTVIEIRPGSAAIAFAGVVIATMLAAEALDPRLIWDALKQDDTYTEQTDE
jgi:paraquat-inducible protein A